MKIRDLIIVFSIILAKSKIILSIELAINEDDIPIIEGDGGTIHITEEENVLVLTKDNFDILALSKEIILIEFYAPWCGHCQSLAPEYSEAAAILKSETPPIPLAKVDATIETELTKEYDVSGYPTLFIFKKGVKKEYNGPRTAQGIVEYMKQEADPSYKPPPKSVIVLTQENFTQVINQEELILVEFYAPWCGHCQRLEPEYERAAKSLRDFSILLAKVDGIDQKELASEYDVSGWPTLLIFRNGKKYKYNGPRDEKGLINYMKEQALPPSTLLTSLKQVSRAQKEAIVIVGNFNNEEDLLYSEFSEAANELRGKFEIFHQFNSDVPQISLYQQEKFLSKYEPKVHVYEKEEALASDIIEFVNKNAIPLVGQKTHSTNFLYQGKYPMVIVYYDVDFSFEHRVQTQLTRNKVAQVARLYKDQITFVIAHEEEFEEELKELGFDDSGEDINVAYFENPKIRFVMEPSDEDLEDSLKEFVENVREGAINRYIKSELVPKVNKGPVVTVVGKNFENLILKSSKDVLLEFYAPWCGHCQKLEPIYNKLGKHYANNDRVFVAKIDATKNDYPADFELKGFPQLFYIPHGKLNKKVEFDGDRNYETLVKFIDEQVVAHSKDEL